MAAQVDQESCSSGTNRPIRPDRPDRAGSKDWGFQRSALDDLENAGSVLEEPQAFSRGRRRARRAAKRIVAAVSGEASIRCSDGRSPYVGAPPIYRGPDPDPRCAHRQRPSWGYPLGRPAGSEQGLEATQTRPPIGSDGPPCGTAGAGSRWQTERCPSSIGALHKADAAQRYHPLATANDRAQQPARPCQCRALRKKEATFAPGTGAGAAQIAPMARRLRARFLASPIIQAAERGQEGRRSNQQIRETRRRESMATSTPTIIQLRSQRDEMKPAHVSVRFRRVVRQPLTNEAHGGAGPREGHG